MRTETTYFAFDETEFDTEEECLAYEAECYQNMSAVAAYDENLTFIERPTAEQWESDVIILKILDAEKAEQFLKWIQDWCSMNTDGLCGELREGDVWAWDDDEGEWFKPLEKYAELKAFAERISEAVNAS